MFKLGSPSSVTAVYAGQLQPYPHYQIMTFTGATAATAISIPGNTGLHNTDSMIIKFSVDGGSVRYRDDGIDPTSTVGLFIVANSFLELHLVNLTAAKFILDSGSSAANVTVAFYCHPDTP